MPKVNRNAQEESEGAPIAQVVEAAVANISITTSPVLIIGVNRKINTGNFENIDVYTGLALPIPGDVSLEDVETLKQAVENAAEEGFKLASKETFQRYAAIKEMQKAGRK